MSSDLEVVFHPDTELRNLRVQVDRRYNAESHAEPPASLIPQFRNCPLRLSHINNELAVENTRQKAVITVSLRVNCRGGVIIAV